VAKAAKEKTDSDYSADWGDNDLEDKSSPSKVTIPEKTAVAAAGVAAASAAVFYQSEKEEPKP
jgi:hypothetical protein